MSSLAGSFLVARTVLADPNFNQTVVLLLEHGLEGAFGLVINRPAELEGDNQLPFPVYSGGPCQAQGLLMLHGQSDWAEKKKKKVEPIAPGIYIGDASTLKKATNADPIDDFRFRVFVGYSGWGPGQLEKELQGGAWTIVPADGESLFDIPVEELWKRLVPPRIPQPSLN